jgi:hypothetical protein
MPTRYPLRQVLHLGPVLVAVLLVACGRSTLQPVNDTLEVSDSGLPTKDDSGLGTKDDSGLGTKDDAGLGTKDDAGLGTKDSGLGADDAGMGDAGPGTEDSGPGIKDAGSGTEDSGPGTEDAGPGPEDAGMPGVPDAGGILGCFACAEQRCAPRVNACVSSPACVEEGTCDLNCLIGSGRGPGGFGGFNPTCFQSCVKDQQTTRRLLAAVSCAFALCQKDCLGALTPLVGGGSGPGGSSGLGGLGGNGVGSPLGL